jgi:signal transduction histidine kinase
MRMPFPICLLRKRINGKRFGTILTRSKIPTKSRNRPYRAPIVNGALRHELRAIRHGGVAELYLNTCRLLCVIAVVLILGFWAVYRYTDPNGNDPLWARAMAAALPLGLLVGTYASETIEKQCVRLMHASIYILTGWFLTLVALNGFSPNYVLGLLVCVFGFALCFWVGLDESKPLLLYLTFTVLASTVASLFAPAPQVSRPLFIACVASTALLLFVEARSRLEVQNALNMTEKRFRVAAEGSLDSFFMLQSVRDASGRLVDFTFIDVNRRAEDLLSKPRAQIVGLSLSGLFPLNHASSFFHKCEHVIQTGESFEEEMHVNIPDSMGVWLLLQIVRMDDGVSIVARDISKTKDFEAELITAKEHAEEVAQLKSAILANMSHEVRTPLTAILGFAQVLSNEVDDQHKEFVQLIAQGAQRLQATLTSVLDLARLETDNYVIRLSEFDVVTHVQGVARLFTTLAEQKGLLLHISVSEPTIPVLLDENALERVLMNLISNAIKFTNRGEVSVRIEADPHIIKIHISDTGIGIGAAFMEHLFEEFKQESEGTSRVYEGSGLGLAITKRLLDYMGGLIEVESEKGCGTHFTVSLPRNLAGTTVMATPDPVEALPLPVTPPTPLLAQA